MQISKQDFIELVKEEFQRYSRQPFRTVPEEVKLMYDGEIFDMAARGRRPQDLYRIVRKQMFKFRRSGEIYIFAGSDLSHGVLCYILEYKLGDQRRCDVFPLPT